MSNLESRHPDDAVPASKGDKQFPLGDIAIAEFKKMNDELFTLRAAWDKDDFILSIDKMALQEEKRNSWNEYQNRVTEEYKRLAWIWPASFDIKPNQGRNLARRALFSTQSFTSDILPPIRKDFKKDFETMCGFNDTEVGEFAVSAWATMQASHPVTYYILREFGDLLADRTCDSEEEYFLVKACVALPYVLSSNSRLLELSQQEAA